ncbi:hypothetical protein VOLCADRAFT_101423, partial [Volvox carteri f. nagariensis]
MADQILPANIPNNNIQNNHNNVVIPPPAAAQGVPAQVVEQLIQHQNFNAVFTNINAGREEALSRRYTDLEQNREASCPKAVKFMAAWIRDIGSKVYSAHSALKVIQATVADVGPVVDILQQSIFIMDLLYASCDAGGRCHQYHLEVMQQYFNNNRHQAVSPTAEVKADTDRLYDCGEDRFRRAVRDVKDRMGTNPLQEVQNFGGRGNSRSRGGYGAQRFHPYQGGGAYPNFSGHQQFSGQPQFG